MPKNELIALDRKMPQNTEAEKKVLGAIMRDKEAYLIAKELLEESDFYEPSHQILFAAIDSLYQSNSKVDLVTLHDVLEKQENIHTTGGHLYWAELAGTIATTVNIEHHAKIVSDRARRRNLIKIMAKSANSLYDISTSTEEVSSTLQQTLTSSAARTGGFRQIGEHFDTLIDRFQEQHQKRINRHDCIDGVETGLIDVDRKTGGLKPGWQIILAARPGQGKTSFAMQIADHASARGNVAVFSHEMSFDEIRERMVSASRKINLRERLTADKASAVLQSYQEFSEKTIWIDDEPSTIDIMEARLRRMAMEIPLHLIVVDYLQLIPYNTRQFYSRNEAVGAICRRLKIIARELKCPLILLSQLSRDVEKRASKSEFEAEPKLSDLRDSGEIEQHADLVWFLHREGNKENSDDDNSGPRSLIFAKFRHGSIGRVPVYFQADYTRFENVAEAEPDF